MGGRPEPLSHLSPRTLRIHPCEVSPTPHALIFLSYSLIGTPLNVLHLLNSSLNDLRVRVTSSERHSLILFSLKQVHFSSIVLPQTLYSHVSKKWPISSYFLDCSFVSLFGLKDCRETEGTLNYSPPSTMHSTWERSAWGSINDSWWINGRLRWPFLHHAGLSQVSLWWVRCRC